MVLVKRRVELDDDCRLACDGIIGQVHPQTLYPRRAPGTYLLVHMRKSDSLQTNTAVLERCHIAPPLQAI